jgi:hemerythrin
VFEWTVTPIGMPHLATHNAEHQNFSNSVFENFRLSIRL